MIRRPPNIRFKVRLKTTAVGYVIRNPFDQSRTANLVLAWGAACSLGILDVDSDTYPFPVKVETGQDFFPESVTLKICGDPYQSEVLSCFSPESPPPKTTVTEATYLSFEGTLV